MLDAGYLPLKIKFDKETKRLYPGPLKNAKWITVCGKEDTQCEKSCKDSEKTKMKANILSFCWDRFFGLSRHACCCSVHGVV